MSDRAAKYLELFLGSGRTHIPFLHESPEGGVIEIVDVALREVYQRALK